VEVLEAEWVAIDLVPAGAPRRRRRRQSRIQQLLTECVQVLGALEGVEILEGLVLLCGVRHPRKPVRHNLLVVVEKLLESHKTHPPQRMNGAVYQLPTSSPTPWTVRASGVESRWADESAKASPAQHVTNPEVAHGAGGPPSPS